MAKLRFQCRIGDGLGRTHRGQDGVVQRGDGIPGRDIARRLGAVHDRATSSAAQHSGIGLVRARPDTAPARRVPRAWRRSSRSWPADRPTVYVERRERNRQPGLELSATMNPILASTNSFVAPFFAQFTNNAPRRHCSRSPRPSRRVRSPVRAADLFVGLGNFDTHSNQAPVQGTCWRRSLPPSRPFTTRRSRSASRARSRRSRSPILVEPSSRHPVPAPTTRGETTNSSSATRSKAATCTANIRRWHSAGRATPEHAGGGFPRRRSINMAQRLPSGSAYRRRYSSRISESREVFDQRHRVHGLTGRMRRVLHAIHLTAWACCCVRISGTHSARTRRMAKCCTSKLPGLSLARSQHGRAPVQQHHGGGQQSRPDFGRRQHLPVADGNDPDDTVDLRPVRPRCLHRHVCRRSADRGGRGVLQRRPGSLLHLVVALGDRRPGSAESIPAGRAPDSDSTPIRPRQARPVPSAGSIYRPPMATPTSTLRRPTSAPKS